MVQNPKGGGLSSSIGGSTQMGGVQKTTDFLDKSTWVLAGALIVLVLLSSLSLPQNSGDSKKAVDSQQSATEKTTEKPKQEAQKNNPVSAPKPN